MTVKRFRCQGRGTIRLKGSQPDQLLSFHLDQQRHLWTLYGRYGRCSICLNFGSFKPIYRMKFLPYPSIWVLDIRIRRMEFTLTWRDPDATDTRIKIIPPIKGMIS